VNAANVNFPTQFSLRSILLVTSLIAIWMALLVAGPPWNTMALTVLIVNFLGILGGKFITNVIGLPNDGSLPWPDQDETDSSNR
jgi:hypothetical protein